MRHRRTKNIWGSCLGNLVWVDDHSGQTIVSFTGLVPWPQVLGEDGSEEEEKPVINKVVMSPNGNFIGECFLCSLIGIVAMLCNISVGVTDNNVVAIWKKSD